MDIKHWGANLNIDLIGDNNWGIWQQYPELPLRESIKFPKDPYYNLFLHDFVLLTNTKTIVEVGTDQGVSADAFCRALMATSGKLLTFDPVDVIQFDKFPDGYENVCTYCKMTGEDGYTQYGTQWNPIDMLYIDTDPHTYDQTMMWLTKYWINNVRSGGYIVLDDCAVRNQPELSGKDFVGVCQAVADWVQENKQRLEYAVIKFNTTSNGTGIIKFKDTI